MPTFLVLLGLFYLVGIPILVSIALRRSSKNGMSDEDRQRLERLEWELDDLKRRINKQPVLSAAKIPLKPSFETVVDSTNAPNKVPPVAPPPPLVQPTVAFSLPHPGESGNADGGPKMAAHFPPPPIAAAPVEPPPDEVADPGAEIRLGARWATRLGIGFLVIAVVFFGAYISQHNPIIRLLEVLLLAAGITALGAWLERQAREWAQAVFAGGLALFYFAAFAAHAIPPMRVIESLEAGLFLQLCAVGVVTGVACWRNQRHSASMAMLLGMVSCFFALQHARIEYSLTAALGLVLVAGALRVLRGWTWPLTIAYAGAQICYFGAVLVAGGHTIEELFADIATSAGTPMALAPAQWPGFTLVFPAAYFVLLIGADILAQVRGRIGIEMVRTGTVLAAALAFGLGGWWGGSAMGGFWDRWNLLAAAAGCLAAGAIYQRRRDRAELYEVLYAAGGAWLAIYFVNEYTGWIRWLALAMESSVFAWRARRKGSPFAWLCFAGAWACSGAMAFIDAQSLGAGLAPWSIERLQFAGWPLLSVVLWSWTQRAPRELDKEEKNAVFLGSALTAGGAFLLGVTAWVHPASWWIFFAVGGLLAIFGFVVRTRAAWFTAVLSLLASMWLFAPNFSTGAGEIVLALALFTIASLAVTAVLGRRAMGDVQISFAGIFEGIFLLSLLYAWFAGLEVLDGDNHWTACVVSLSALGLAALAWCGPWRMFGDLSWAWAAAGLLNSICDGQLWNHGVNAADFIGLGIILGLGWLWGALDRREPSKVWVLQYERAGWILPGPLVAGWVALAFPTDWTASHLALAWAGSAVLVGIAGRREWLPGGGVAAGLLALAAWMRVVSLKLHAPAECVTPALVMAAILFLGWLGVRRSEQLRASRNAFLLFVALLALGMFDWSVSSLPPKESQHLTILWAGAGAALFACGLGARVRSYRYVGLAGLAICVPRVFIVDITDTLGRIFAFGVLAVVLLAIGFSYHRLRPWLVARDEN